MVAADGRQCSGIKLGYVFSGLFPGYLRGLRAISANPVPGLGCAVDWLNAVGNVGVLGWLDNMIDDKEIEVEVMSEHQPWGVVASPIRGDHRLY
jgi:hypothetical protein